VHEKQKLADLHTRGIRTIVDPTTVDILPALRAAGVTADQIEQMLVRNPRAIFEAVG
jgi:predicted metal-dependent phosphotriesterase family hydrolase